MREQSSDYNNLKQWLPPKIEKTGLSIEKFAESVGITRTALYQYLGDVHRPSEQIMAKICQALAVPLEEGLRQYTPRKSGRPAGRYIG